MPQPGDATTPSADGGPVAYGSPGPRAGSGSHTAIPGMSRPGGADVAVEHAPAPGGGSEASTGPTDSTGEAALPWYRRGAGFVLAVLGIYALARLFSGIVLFLVGLHQVDVTWFENETGYFRMTVLWDAFWYRQIVEDGYPPQIPRNPESGKPWQNPWAFYPMFPMMTRFVMQLTGLGFAVVGSTLSLVAGGVAAVLMAILLRDRVGVRVALAGVAIWATCITAPTLQVAYTESMALVLLTGVLLALSRERWWTAAVIALLTGLTRPIAAPLGLVALVAVWMRWRQRHVRPLRGREAIAIIASLGACGLSALLWPFIAWLGTGEPDAYTSSMTAWRAVDKIQLFVPWWNSALSWTRTPAAAVLALLAFAGLMFAVAAGPWARALGPQLRTWCLAYPFYLFAVQDPSTSIYRYAICLFPWTIVMVGAGWGRTGEDAIADEEDPVRGTGGSHVAVLRRRMRRTTTRRVLAWTLAWVVFGLLTQVWWIWEIWQFTPPADDPP
ncbi:glycosyltransferase family 39 protein [Agilicoccus flavus]|uniref:glycosyltransferase family 39 protein n=1 Tax=Agilicoccus flavus TaxID=2775968 RepID=UPI001CF642F5|nr:glycosyltransferase family 39 protein [Agilicoccus flavus]